MAEQGAFENVKAVIEKENAKKVIIFTDKGIRSTGLLDLLTDILEENKTEYQVFDDLVCEPSYQDVEKVMKEVENTSVMYHSNRWGKRYGCSKALLRIKRCRLYYKRFAQ